MIIFSVLLSQFVLGIKTQNSQKILLLGATDITIVKHTTLHALKAMRGFILFLQSSKPLYKY